MTRHSLLSGAVFVSAVLSAAVLPAFTAGAEQIKKHPEGHAAPAESRPAGREHSFQRSQEKAADHAAEHAAETAKPINDKPVDGTPPAHKGEGAQAAGHDGGKGDGGKGAGNGDGGKGDGGKGAGNGDGGKGDGGKGNGNGNGNGNGRTGERIVINDYNRTVIDEGFGRFWPIGPEIALVDDAIIGAFGWQPAEAMVETLPLVDFGECHYHVVTDRVTGAQKYGVWIDGKEVLAGSDRAIEQVLTNCTEVNTPAATFAQVVTGFYPELAGYNLVSEGIGIQAPEIIRETDSERLTYYVRNKANDTMRVNATWGPKQAVQIKADKL